MKKWYNVPKDLYVLKEEVEKLMEGDSALGYIKVKDKSKYEKIDRRGIQPVREDRIIDKNTYEIVLIFE